MPAPGTGPAGSDRHSRGKEPSHPLFDAIACRFDAEALAGKLADGWQGLVSLGRVRDLDWMHVQAVRL